MSWLKTHRNDALLVAVLLLLGGALALYLNLTREAGGRAVVQVNGEVLMELPLDTDTRITLGTGEDTNLLVIESGAAQVIEATCPDQVCVRQGAVRYEGESIVCLPHKLVVTIQGGQPNGVDGSTG